MSLRHQRLVAVFLTCIPIALGCTDENNESDHSNASVSYVNASDSLPRIRFADGLVSLNDRCMVRQNRLNLRVPPIYVNGEPVGFC